jgi:L-lactate dehydrogenase (cytochrome)
MSKQGAAYYHTGSLDGVSMRENKDAFRKCRLVPRVMRNVTSIRPQTSIFGLESALPIYISPASNAMLGHPDGELNLTRGVGSSVVAAKRPS